ncbi:arsenic transport integral membrane protein ArsB [Capsulimonas corticalis]|uniref:Arsenic transport integral membrane protein ArsB n=1 Tax=Capsulimonas corticalis TaxID=2219043 RepID=A0A402CTZ2_9BACT|nr:ArsB/NhaD family transporter [Capsulimonas corticalis]BDI28782.1 arsenic transport integral membrane protein ArsB [Capsulimonas corticalis]
MHLVLTLGVFLLTLTLILLRPRGMNEAWATGMGGAAMLLLGLETPGQAWRTVAQGADVLAFLLALMALSALIDLSGFFAWAALHAARMARGDGGVLYRNVFILGAVVTMLLSLDTTAVILTPIVLSFVGRLKLSARPFLIACAFVANTGSLLLPVSNLTNLLFVGAFHWSFGAFVLRMALPQIAALAANYALFRRLFRREIPKEYALEGLPRPSEAISDPSYFRAALFVLAGVLIGYFIGALAGILPYVIAFAGCLVLIVWGKWRRRVSLRRLSMHISWSLFPFVVGLFVVVRGVENLGLPALPALAARGLAAAGGASAAQIGVTAFGAGMGSNVVNNIPMALLAISSLRAAHAGPAAQYGALLGCNLGPNLTVAGSLATMLVISNARKRGEDIGAADFFQVGSIATPIILLAAALGLWAALRVFLG